MEASQSLIQSEFEPFAVNGRPIPEAAKPYFRENGTLINEGVVLDFAAEDVIPCPAQIAVAQAIGNRGLNRVLPAYADSPGEARELIVNAVHVCKTPLPTTPRKNCRLRPKNTVIAPKQPTPINTIPSSIQPIPRGQTPEVAKQYPTLQETIEMLESDKSDTRKVVAIKDHFLGCDISNPDEMMRSFRVIGNNESHINSKKHLIGSADLAYAATAINSYENYDFDEVLSAIENWSRELLSEPIYDLYADQTFMINRITDFRVIATMLRGKDYLLPALKYVENIAKVQYPSQPDSRREINQLIAPTAFAISVSLLDVDERTHAPGIIHIQTLHPRIVRKHKRIIDEALTPKQRSTFEKISLLGCKTIRQRVKHPH